MIFMRRLVTAGIHRLAMRTMFSRGLSLLLALAPLCAWAAPLPIPDNDHPPAVTPTATSNSGASTAPTPLTTRVPTALQVEQTNANTLNLVPGNSGTKFNVLLVTFDPTKFEPVTFNGDDSVYFAVSEELFVYPESETKPERPYCESLNGSRLGTVFSNDSPDIVYLTHFSMPAAGKKYIVEADLTLTQASNSPQHFCSPNGPIVWTRVLKRTVTIEPDLPGGASEPTPVVHPDVDTKTVQLNLTSAKTQWPVGESVELSLALSNISGKTFRFKKGMYYTHVEVDEVWYELRLGGNGGYFEVAPAKTETFTTENLAGPGWYDAQEHELKLTPGKHTVRFGVEVSSGRVNTTEEFNRHTQAPLAMSNFVEFEIVSAPTHLPAASSTVPPP